MSTLVLRLDIRILHEMRVQQFIVPLNLDGPATLEVKLGRYALGNEISIIGEDNAKRVWYASRIHQIKFEFIDEEKLLHAAQSHEKIGTL